MEQQGSTGISVLSLCWDHCALTFKQGLVGEGKMVGGEGEDGGGRVVVTMPSPVHSSRFSSSGRSPFTAPHPAPPASAVREPLWSTQWESRVE